LNLGAIGTTLASHGQSGEAYKSGQQSVVTNALVGVVADCLISDGGSAMVDGDHLNSAVPHYS
jgi:hypothetical protein